MENILKMGNFQELTHDELMEIDGGNIWNNVW
ncbi:MAG: bacteriocin class II family protein [Defluviitaleaceae bacterium]|nr:bacteriocin class II family protein [Defluviitaleaceae bacterium]